RGHDSQLGRGAGRGQPDIDGLKVLQLSANAPDIVVIQQVRPAFQEGHAGLSGAHAEVLEVAAVADARDVGIESHVFREVGDIGEVEVAAVVVRLLVIGQKGALDLA